MNTGQPTNPVVLVSGAAGGLGAALCAAYLKTGARVVALDLDARRLEALAATCGAPDGQLLTQCCDISDAAAAQAAVAQALGRCGGIDILINNAGISARSLFADTGIALARALMEVNYFGALYLTDAALPSLRARQGRLVCISSVAGFSPLLGRTAYAASKHALHGLFDSLRCELRDAGVSVTLVCPSFIATGIDAAALGAGVDGKAARARVTGGRESAPAAIAARIVRAVARRQALLLPDTTARLAWWLSRLAPALYARAMTRRIAAEFCR